MSFLLAMLAYAVVSGIFYLGIAWFSSDPNAHNLGALAGGTIVMMLCGFGGAGLSRIPLSSPPSYLGMISAAVFMLAMAILLYLSPTLQQSAGSASPQELFVVTLIMLLLIILGPIGFKFLNNVNNRPAPSKSSSV